MKMFEKYIKNRYERVLHVTCYYLLVFFTTFCYFSLKLQKQIACACIFVRFPGVPGSPGVPCPPRGPFSEGSESYSEYSEMFFRVMVIQTNGESSRKFEKVT